MSKRQKKSPRREPNVSSTKKLPDLAVAPLVEADRRLKSIQIANEVATWTWDILNDRVVADQNLAQLFGVSPEVAAGGSIERYLECIHPDDRTDVKSAIAKVLEGPNDRYETIYRVVRKDGSTSWVSARGTVERGPDGKPRYFPGVVIDITELRVSEQRTDDLRFRLEKQSRIL